MMGRNSCAWTMKILPENGKYESIFGPFLKLKRNLLFFLFFFLFRVVVLLGPFLETEIIRIRTEV